MSVFRQVEKHTTRPLLLLDVIDRYASQCGSASVAQRPLITPDYGAPRIYLVAQISNGRRIALSQPLRMMVQPTLSGIYGLYGGVIIGRAAELDQRRVAREDIRVNMVPTGTYVVQITHPYYRTVERNVEIPTPRGYPVMIQLEPSESYPIAERRTGLHGTVIAKRQNPQDALIPIPFATITVEIKGNTRVQLPCTVRADADGAWEYYFREALLDQYVSNNTFEVTLTIVTPKLDELPADLPPALQPLRIRTRSAKLVFTATRGTVTDIPTIDKVIEVKVQ